MKGSPVRSNARRLKPGSTELRYLVEQVIEALTDLAIDADVSLPELADIAKAAYVRRAAKRATRPNGTVNKSRVAAITGLTRTEASMLLDPHSMQQHPPKRSRAGRVMDAWSSDTRFLDDKRRPRTLPIAGTRGSFTHLVKLYAGDVPPRAILERLLKLSLVTKLPANGPLPARVRPNRTPKPPVDRRIATPVLLLARCLEDAETTWVKDASVAARDPAQQAMIQNAIIERAQVFLSGLTASFPASAAPANSLQVFVGIANNTATPTSTNVAKGTRR